MDVGVQRSFMCPVLIGRDSVLERAQRLLGEDARGNRAMLIAAEAGLGKSRLVAVIKAVAATDGFLIREGACFLQDRAEPYASLVDAVRARFAGLPPKETRAALGPFAPDLQTLIPSLLPHAPHAARLPAVPPPEQERRRLFAALASCLVDQTGTAPILLVIEDLHWSDQGTLDFLIDLLRRTAHRRLVLVGTYRPDEMPSHLQAWRHDLDREQIVDELRLDPLDRDGTSAMVRAILGAQQPGMTASDALVDALHALAEGNPLAIEELLASQPAAKDSLAVEPASVAGAANMPLPRSLHAAVQQRVARLSHTSTQILQFAAVAGRRFDFELLLAVAGMEEAELLDLIEEMVATRLVVEEPSGRFAFRHALTRQAIYADLLARRRALLHRRVGEAAERVYAAAIEQHLGDLAEHFYRAAAWEKACDYAQQAGERALRLTAWRAAVEHFSRALEAGDRFHASHQRSPDDLDRTHAAAAHRGRGRAFDLLGDFERARADYKRAVELARAADDAPEACRALLDAALLWASRDYTRVKPHLDDALDLARRIEDPTLLVDCLNRLGNWHANAGEPRRATALHDEALATIEPLDDRRRLAATLDLLGMAAYLGLDFGASMSAFERAAALFREMDDRPSLLSCLTMLAVRGGTYEMPVVAHDDADADAGLRAGEEALALARAIDSPAGEAFASLQMAGILGPRGDFGRALELCERGLALAEGIGHRQWLTAVNGLLGALYLDLLAPDRARTHLEYARSLAREMGSLYWDHKTAALLAMAYARLHEPERAAAILRDAPSVTGPVRTVGEWLVVCAETQLAIVRREGERALRLCDRLRPTEVDGRGLCETSQRLRLRAEALITLARSGERDAAADNADMRTAIAEATDALESARAAMHRQGRRSELWRMQATLGEIHRVCGRVDDARHAFTAARATIEAVAATISDESLRQGFLRNATAQLPRAYRLSSLSSVAARHGGLSTREREVAALIAQGKSNSEIAAALVLGKRTIETHVSNLFTKLGVTSRQEIADWSASRGLTGL